MDHHLTALGEVIEGCDPGWMVAQGETIQASIDIGGRDGQDDFHLAADAQHGGRPRMLRTVSRLR
jgi:hypothetical protein